MAELWGLVQGQGLPVRIIFNSEDQYWRVFLMGRTGLQCGLIFCKKTARLIIALIMELELPSVTSTVG